MVLWDCIVYSYYCLIYFTYCECVCVCMYMSAYVCTCVHVCDVSIYNMIYIYILLIDCAENILKKFCLIKKNLFYN